jgi:cation transport protein ChaC
MRRMERNTTAELAADAALRLDGSDARIGCARGPQMLTRDLLASGGFRRLLEQAGSSLRLVTDEERERSLDRMLAAQPEPGAPVWVFAYGSLLWNPTVHVAERARARVTGWHRRFCLWTELGRGSCELPGLLLGLERGGSCTGVALRVDGELRHELDLLWRREMVGNSYVPRWLHLALDDGRRAHGIGFTINHAGPGYARQVDDRTAARHIAHACGPMGACREYFDHTLAELHRWRIRDRHMERIARLLPEA